jgi:MarR family 2-MHQ and catechol resistance regulon transcriptional repressor
MPTRYKGRPAEVRALDAYIKLLRAAKSVNTRLERHLSSHGLTESQFGVLEALLHVGPMCQRELGTKILRSGANVTTVVDNLEKRALVRRERGDQDRRYVTVYLTGEGRALVEKVFPFHLRQIVESFAALESSEIEALDRLCKKLGLSQPD